MQFRSVKCVSMALRVAKSIKDVSAEKSAMVPVDEFDKFFHDHYKALHKPFLHYSPKVTYFKASASKTFVEPNHTMKEVASFLADAKIESPRSDPTKMDRFPFFKGSFDYFFTHKPSKPRIVDGLLYVGNYADHNMVERCIASKFETLRHHHSTKGTRRVVTGNQAELFKFALLMG